MGKERAIVSEIAGTTRDVIDADWSLDGLLFTLTDTAGLRETEDVIEAEGVRRSSKAMDEADLIVYLVDVSSLLIPGEQMVIAGLRDRYPHKSILVVGNKLDRVSPTDSHDSEHYKTQTDTVSEGDKSWSEEQSDDADEIQSIAQACVTDQSNQVSQQPDINKLTDYKSLIDLNISASTGAGIDQLKHRMKASVLGNRDIDTSGLLVTSSRHRDALQKARNHVIDAMSALETGATGDFISIDLRAALRELGAVTGEIHNEDILSSIFSRFCIGK
jgi:tRNA modification GTPase